MSNQLTDSASERQIHLAVMDFVNLHPSIKNNVIHIPNEGKRSLTYGGLLKRMGMRKGVSDLFIAQQHHGFGGAWIELKRKAGTLTADQVKFLNHMESQNYFTAVCYGIDDTIELIKWYCNL